MAQDLYKRTPDGKILRKPQKRPDESRPSKLALEDKLFKYIDGVLTEVDAKGKPVTGGDSNLQLRTNTMYKSQDGRRIRILEYNKESKLCPFTGLIESTDKDGNPYWKGHYWNANGIAKKPCGAGYDIVSIWSST